MKTLPYLLAICLIGAAGPALAQMDLSIESPDDASSGTPSLELSAPPDLSAPVEPSHMSEPPQFTPSDAPDEPEMSDETDDPDVPVGPPVASKDALQAFMTACLDVSSGDPKGYDRANDAGWSPYEGEDDGPYKNVYSGFREFGGYGQVDIWGSVETYPTQKLGYCRLDFEDPDSRIDFADMTGLGLTGTVEDRGADGLYGVWEAADHRTLVIASRVEGTVAIEFNVLPGPPAAQN